MKKLLVLIPWIIMLLIYWEIPLFGASQQTSSTAASVIIDNVESLLNDSDNNMWSAGDLLVWLNEGQVDIAMRSECLQSTESIALATNTLEYTITSDYIAVKAVHYVESASVIKALLPGSPVSVGMVQNVEEPVYWYDWGGELGVYPTFTRTAETVTVYLISRPSVLVSTDNITIPAIYEPALTFYMMARAWMRDRTYSKYSQMTTLYEAEMTRLKKSLNEYPAKPIDE